MNGKALPSEVKEYIVTQLAGFSAPFEIQEQVKEIFGVDVTKQHIQYYNPHSYTGKTLISKYLELFNVRREIFLNQVQDIPIANVAVRLKRLENSWIQLIAKKNYIAANAVLEQAAKEASGFYSPRSQQLPSQEGESFVGWLKNLGASALPIIHDVETIENTAQQKQITQSESILGSVPKEKVKAKEIIAPKWNSK